MGGQANSRAYLSRFVTLEEADQKQESPNQWRKSLTLSDDSKKKKVNVLFR